MRTILAIVLMAGATCALAGTKSPMIYDCSNASGADVIDLACNIYFEARAENDAGQYMVGHVVMNRVESRLYPNTVSAVVYEIRRSAKTGRRVPMFSWTLDGRIDRVYNAKAWGKALEIAANLVDMQERGVRRDISFGAMWYHNPEIVTPSWSHHYFATIQVGRHKFYAANERAFHTAMLGVQG